MKKDDSKIFRVLTIDGGGVRGLYTAALLDDLTRHYAEKKQTGALDLGKGFNLIAGTSTGGILACALASGVPLDEIMDLYISEGQKIFPSPIPDKKPGLALWAARHSCKSSADSQVFQNKLVEVFGEKTLENVYLERGIALCIPSVYASSMGSKVFKTPHLPSLTIDKKRLLADVCMATSAAPIVFPISEQVDPGNSARKEHFVDGGLWANNPVLVGMLEALAIVQENQEYDEIHVFSIGTCAPSNGNVVSTLDKGLLSWKFGIEPLNHSLEAQADGTGHIARLLAEHLKVKTKVIRLPSDPPSNQESKALGLDNATQKAVQILLQRSQQDSQLILSRIRSRDESLMLLEDVFQDMPERGNNAGN
ncbi:MAG: CBASS cGAMP-activated phospholipase [Halodesulfovibrio sp.]|uniref:CBASS cGAMP-activated phospholipase n=1 Tax=Halodesulfovibrio sp. TaxID=1912772 RepID=UPI00359E3D8B